MTVSQDCSEEEKSIDEEPADVSPDDFPWEPSELPPEPDPPRPCQENQYVSNLKEIVYNALFFLHAYFMQGDRKENS